MAGPRTHTSGDAARLRSLRQRAGARLPERRPQCDPTDHLTATHGGMIPTKVGASSPIPFGRYTLIERLAVGGMAELFLGTAPGEHGFQRQVVIKRLLPNLAREPVYTAMFIDEAKLTAKLSHPKIAQTYELGRVGTELFIAMEFVDGLDVLAMLRELAWQRRRMPTELAVWVTHEVLDALDFAHNLKDEQGNSLGIVHRDISPSNVLLSRRGDVKLVDFGIARAVGPGRHHRTKSGTLKGKYGYMSPEQVIEQPVDARSDLFSAGVVLAEMLCGRRLFAATAEIDVLLMVRDAKLSRLDQYGGHIPGSLDAILRKALSKDPADRHASAADMRDALQD
ncbi:MAG: serine/threonine protein kinase, partial [Kofleriaceae bacterium]